MLTWPIRSSAPKSVTSRPARPSISAAARGRTPSYWPSLAGPSSAFDWAEEAIRLAKQAARGRDLEATFIVADTTKWTPGTQFNLVVSAYALPGGENSRRVLQTAANAVAPAGTLIIAEWDRSMAEVWPCAAEDLTTPDEIAGVLRGLAVERAEVRRIEAFAKDDPRASSGTAANVAFVRARRRAQRPDEPTSGP